MPYNLRVTYTTGASLFYSIEMLGSGFHNMYDTSTSGFTLTPVQPLTVLPEGTGIFAGSYDMSLTSTPKSTFTNGNYYARIHNSGASNMTIGGAYFKMYNGDEVDVLPLDLGQIIYNSGVSTSGVATLNDVFSATFIGNAGAINQNGTVLTLKQPNGTTFKVLVLDSATNPQNRQ